MLLELFGLTQLLLLVQATPPSIAGTIRDGETGRPLADAIVALTDIDRWVVSDSGGRYLLADVPSGPQHLTIQRAGYAPRTLHALVPGDGRLQIDISLHPVPMQLPALVVRSPVPVRGVEIGDSTSLPERGISMAAVRNDPLLSEPDGFLGLSGGEIGASPESPSGINVRGGASDQTQYLLDGIPVFSPYHAAGTFSAWNPDALERLEVSSASPSPAWPDALSGTISAATRVPGSRVRAQGGMSTTQARIAVDGPLGPEAGYLASFRTGFAGLIAPKREPSYLSGEISDLLAKVEMPALGGRVRVLFYDTHNAIGSALSADTAGGRLLHSGFEWGSRSMGAEWTRPIASGLFRLQAWTASSDAEATWLAVSPQALQSDRSDQGLLAAFQRVGPGSRSTVGVRIQRSRTGYRVAPMDDSVPAFELRARTPVAAVFVQHQRSIGPGVDTDLGASVAYAASDIHLKVTSQLRWRVSDPLILTASLAHTHQFAQSLRNSESVTGNVFPADLYIGAGALGVPVARSDRVVLAADYRPAPNFRLGAQAYLSNSAGLLLVAPRTDQPFATDGFATGEGGSPGFSLDAALSGARYGLVARYGWQRVSLKHADTSYVPVYATSHLLELGGIMFPSATTSVRLGLTGGLGRRATAVTGSFEWESCNLLDRGCEFGGTPRAAGPLGATRLPAYLRLDLSLRKHWHLNLGGRDVTLALFGTVTNLLSRTNVLTEATDSNTGRRTKIEMRPLAPLVIGLDWRL
jgi:carboxypeptidase family protein/TonB-dependent receptor-like protein